MRTPDKRAMCMPCGTLMMRAEVAQPQPIQEIGKGKPGPGRGHKTPDNVSRLYGNDPDYLAARIARDHPDILDRMKSGDYPSVRAAPALC